MANEFDPPLTPHKLEGMTAEDIKEMESSLAGFDAGDLPEEEEEEAKGPSIVMLGKGGSSWMPGLNGAWLVHGISQEDWRLYTGKLGNRNKGRKATDG